MIHFMRTWFDNVLDLEAENLLKCYIIMFTVSVAWNIFPSKQGFVSSIIRLFLIDQSASWPLFYDCKNSHRMQWLNIFFVLYFNSFTLAPSSGYTWDYIFLSVWCKYLLQSNW